MTTPRTDHAAKAVLDDKSAIKQLITSIGGQISASLAIEEIVKLRLVRVTVKAIAAARWGSGWHTT